MKAFLTGGTGFVGSHLAEELLLRGYRVRALVRNRPRWLDGLDVERAAGDLFDPGFLRSAVADVDYVFHVGGLTRAPTRVALFEANVSATAALLHAVREAGGGVSRVVVTSSQAAAGPSPTENGTVRPTTEEDPMRPLSLYGESKAEMERLISSNFSDLPITVIRPPAVYGPREADIFTAIQTADRLRIFPVVGDRRQARLSLVHVRDLVRGIADAADSEATAGETLFIGSERGYSWDEIRDAIGAALGKRLVTVPVPSPLVMPIGAIVESVAGLLGKYPPLNRDKAREAREAWVSSVAKAGRLIGYSERVTLMEGMTETVAWYRAAGWL